MTKPKTSTQKANERHERETRMIEGIRLRVDAAVYAVWRYKSPDAKGKPEACGIDVRDERAGAWKRIDRFPIDGAAEDGGAWGPSWRRVLEIWGSGTYKLQWFRNEAGRMQAMGFSPASTFNDPGHPQLPAYRRMGDQPAQQPAAPPAAPSPADTSTDVAAAIAAASKDGKIEVPVAMLLVQLVQGQANVAESMFRGWMQQEQARRAELEADYDRRRQRDAEWSRQENERTASFWAAQTRAARELTSARGGGDDDADDRIDSLAESVESLAETVKSGQNENTQFMLEVLKMFGPAVAARFAGPGQPPPLPPNGQT